MTRREIRPRGSTLVEMVVTLTVLAILLGLGAGLIRLVVRLDHSSRDARDAALARARLARDFRADVHAARAVTGATVADDGRTLALDLIAGGSSTYTVRPDSVLREVRDGDGDHVRRREVYRLADRTTARFAPPPSDGPPLVVLIVRPDPDAPATATPPPPANRTVAELGRRDDQPGRKP